MTSGTLGGLVASVAGNHARTAFEAFAGNNSPRTSRHHGHLHTTSPTFLFPLLYSRILHHSRQCAISPRSRCVPSEPSSIGGACSEILLPTDHVDCRPRRRHLDCDTHRSQSTVPLRVLWLSALTRLPDRFTCILFPTRRPRQQTWAFSHPGGVSLAVYSPSPCSFSPSPKVAQPAAASYLWYAPAPSSSCLPDPSDAVTRRAAHCRQQRFVIHPLGNQRQPGRDLRRGSRSLRRLVQLRCLLDQICHLYRAFYGSTGALRVQSQAYKNYHSCL